jgi:NADPH:quinone reductase-like Zn-dependent oxidoreductase
MMRAILIHEQGGPQAHRPTDLANPEPPRGEALVRVKAVPVNGFPDISNRMGQVACVHSSPPVPAPGPGGADRR